MTLNRDDCELDELTSNHKVLINGKVADVVVNYYDDPIIHVGRYTVPLRAMELLGIPMEFYV